MLETVPEKNVQNYVEKPVFEGEILVCEDNPMNQQIVSEHLKRVGLQAVIASNGKEAVKIVRKRMESPPANGKKPFDIIFMDIYMPIMNGLKAASKITAMNTGIPIVAMTSNISDNEVETYKMSGMPDYLSKPFTSKELCSCLSKYLKPVNMEIIQKSIEDDVNMQLLIMVQENFLKSKKNIYNEIIQALEKDDIELAHRLAHTLKSNAGQMGETRLQKTAAVVEEQLKHGKNTVSKEQFVILEAEINRVLKELALHFGKPETKPNEAHSPLTPQRINELTNILFPLLKSGNPECLNYINEIRAIPESSDLIQQMEDFNFDLALSSLIKITEGGG